MDKRDWYDIVSHNGRYPHSYQIQWDMVTGNVRAKPNNSERWSYADVSVKSQYALMIGYELLERRKT